MMDEQSVERLLAEQFLELAAAGDDAESVATPQVVEPQLGTVLAEAVTQFWGVAAACRRRCTMARIMDAHDRVELLEALLTETAPATRIMLERRLREAFVWASVVDDEARARRRLVNECCRAVVEITELCGWRGRLAGEAAWAVRQQTQRLCDLETRLIG